MPKTHPDADFTNALRKFVTDGCGGSKALAAAKLGVPRQHLGQYWKGGIPLGQRKKDCLAVMARAGYYPGAGLSCEPPNGTLVTKNVTENADPSAVATMLRFLLDLVERSRQPEASLSLPRGRENDR